MLSANAACSPLALMSCLNTPAVFQSLLFCSFLCVYGGMVEGPDGQSDGLIKSMPPPR